MYGNQLSRMKFSLSVVLCIMMPFLFSCAPPPPISPRMNSKQTKTDVTSVLKGEQVFVKVAGLLCDYSVPGFVGASLL